MQDFATPTVDLILGEQDGLHRLARRLVRCMADADDLVQDTLLRAFRARDRFTPGTSIRAWTSTILRRVYLTGALRAKRRGVHCDTDLDAPLRSAPAQPTSEGRFPADGFEDLGEEFDEDLKRALDRVPAVYREPLFLQVFKDMTCEEIAKRLGVPQGTVMSRIHRARLRLRAELTSDAPKANTPRLSPLGRFPRTVAAVA